jgi:hypothetical protein
MDALLPAALPSRARQHIGSLDAHVIGPPPWKTRPMNGGTRSEAVPSVPGVLALFGGLMVALGSTLDWFGGTSVGASALSVSGLESAEGKAAFVCGAVAVVLGVGAMTGRVPRRRGAMAALIVAGVVAVALAAYSAATADDRLVGAAVARITERRGVAEAEAQALVEAAFRSHDVSVSVEAGLFLVLAGGALVVAGGALPLLSGLHGGSPR